MIRDASHVLKRQPGKWLQKILRFRSTVIPVFSRCFSVSSIGIASTLRIHHEDSGIPPQKMREPAEMTTQLNRFTPNLIEWKGASP